jgi:hypothetical protein
LAFTGASLDFLARLMMFLAFAGAFMFLAGSLMGREEEAR